MTKDEEKQKAIIKKSAQDASSTAARSIAYVTPSNASTPAAVPASNATRISPLSPPVQKAEVSVRKVPAAAATPAKVASPAPKAAKPDALPTRISMTIQKIPPFNPDKRRTVVVTNGIAGTSASSVAQQQPTAPASPTTSVTSSTSNAFRLNTNAPAFRPNPNASAFKPVRNIFPEV